MSSEVSPIEGWAVLELFGHRRLGGYLHLQEMAGAAFIRIDVPGTDGEVQATQFYNASSVYAITPTTEELARAVSVQNQPEPVHRYELPPSALTKLNAGDYRSYESDDDPDF